jgi:hypothetical protein
MIDFFCKGAGSDLSCVYAARHCSSLTGFFLGYDSFLI